MNHRSLLTLVTIALITTGCAAPNDPTEREEDLGSPGEVPAASADTTPTSVGKAVAPRPADLALVEAHLSKREVVVGEQVRLEWEVRNAGDASGSFSVQFTVEGLLAEGSATVELRGGATERGYFTYTPTSKGRFSLQLVTSALGDRATTRAISEEYELTVKLPANLVITETSLSHREIAIGETATITASLQNQGEVRGERTVRLLVDGQVYASEIVRLEPGTSASVVFEYKADSRGTFGMSVESQSVGALIVYRPATFELRDLAASPVGPQLEEAVTTTFEIENSGDKAGSVNVALRLGGLVIYQDQVYVGAQDSKRVAANPVSFKDPLATRVTISLDGKDAKTLDLSPRLPDLLVTSVQTPYNSDYNCFDYAYTTIQLQNKGQGRDFNVKAEFYVDGVKKNIKLEGNNNLMDGWSIGTTEAGYVVTSPRVEIMDVEDFCGENDPHELVVRLTAKYSGTKDTGAIPFTV